MERQVRVGDAVKFEVNGEQVVDCVKHIGHGFIEGEKYDLTYTDFTIVDFQHIEVVESGGNDGKQ